MLLKLDWLQLCRLFFSVVMCVSPLATVYAGVLSSITPTQQYRTNYNLSAADTQWAIWGQGTSDSLSPSDKSLGMTDISDLTEINNGGHLRGIGQYSVGSTFQWSDGTNSLTSSAVHAGLQHVPASPAASVGEGFSMFAVAGTQLRTLTLFVTVHDGEGRIVASLSDNSAAPITWDVAGNQNTPFEFEFQYSADSANKALNISFIISKDTSGGAPNVAIAAATLYNNPTPPPGSVPEPTSMAIFGLGALGIAYRNRRKLMK